MAKQTQRGCPNSLYVSGVFFSRSVFLSKFLKIPTVFVLLSKKFRAFGGNQEGLSIQHFTCGEQHSEGKYEKSTMNYFSRTYREKKSKNLWQTFQNCNCFVLRSTLRKFVSLKYYFFPSVTLSVTFLPSGKQIQLASQNFILRVQKNKFLVKNTSKCTIFSFLVLTAKKSLRKYFWPNCQKCFWFVHCNSSQKFRLLKIRFFLSGSLNVSFMFLAKQNERGCQNNILRVRRFSWKKNLFEIFKVFSSFVHFVQDVLSLSVGKKWNACQNSNQSIYTEDQITLKIEEKWKNPKLFKFLVLTAVSSLRKTFGRLVKSVPILSTVTFWGKVIFVKIYFFLYGILSVSYTPYGKTNSARLSKLFVRVRSVFWQKCFFIEVSENSYRFCTLSKKFRAFGGNQEGLSIQHFTCGEQHSEGKYEKSTMNYFSRTYREKKSKNLWQTFQNCNCLVLRSTLRKFASLKYYFFLSVTLSVTFLPSGKQIQLASQNFILRVQKNKFLVKNTSKCTIFSFLVLTTEKVAEGSLADLTKLFLSRTKKQFDEICFLEYFFSFWDFECNFSTFWKGNSDRLSKFHSKCP